MPLTQNSFLDLPERRGNTGSCSSFFSFLGHRVNPIKIKKKSILHRFTKLHDNGSNRDKEVWIQFAAVFLPLQIKLKLPHFCKCQCLGS